MELRHLRYFVHVAEELHFGRAAARLGISQPPLSQQIRLLEDEVGVPLLARTSRRVRLTEAGALFLDEARRTLAQADRAIEVARRSARGEAGEVAVGFSPSVPLTGMVAQALSTFRRNRPGVRLALSEMTRAGQIAALAAERIAIGLVRSIDPPQPDPRTIVTMMTTEPLLVALPGDHPLAAATAPLGIAQLRDEGFIHYTPDLGAGFNEQFARLCGRAGFVPDVVQEVSGPATLLGLVAAGMGISVIARSLGNLHPDNVVLRPLDAPELESRLWLMHRPDLTAAAGHFVALIHAGRAGRTTG